MKKKPAAYSVNPVEFTPSEDRTYDIGSSLTVKVWYPSEDSIVPDIRMYDDGDGGLVISSPSEFIEFSQIISRIAKTYFTPNAVSRHYRRSALNKLTQEERTALGLPEPSEV